MINGLSSSSSLFMVNKHGNENQDKPICEGGVISNNAFTPVTINEPVDPGVVGVIVVVGECDDDDGGVFGA
ncbi:hypothetical protein DERP_009507 [Dermatophagoides pteronyssinus]|uniref:Uncharacterized protein n=1 Tax=Dermatophagoides pteronyssinus TaxID=6956 RepID=A0ABQ8IUC5_DERPT|nr:hypothetical protein DERP_009507 [Dermatophagoides pteronyssinus]